MHPLQEKFQITVPAPKKDNPEHNEWADFQSTRRGHGMSGFCPATSADVDMTKMNVMPPGMEIDGATHAMPDESRGFSMGGATDVNSGNRQLTPEAFKDGFVVHQMKGTDDQYTGEHVDHFYGVAVGDDGNEGFVERNNYLDRE